MTKRALHPKQARSRESSRKLLEAAAEVLGQHGLEGATIPRIARHAGLTPGAVYRRFVDKDALIETLMVGVLESSSERLRTAMTPEMVRQIPLPVLVDQIIGSMLLSVRVKPGLIRAFRQFVQSSKNNRFKATIRKMEMGNLRYLVDLLLEHRQQIRHPNPEVALFFAVRTVSGALTELFVVDREMRNWPAAIPKDDAALKSEFKCMFLNYLDVERDEAR